MEDTINNYPYKYEFYTVKDPSVDSEQLTKVSFKVESKFIKLPFYDKGIGIDKLIPFKNSIPYKLTDSQGQSYRVNKEMYTSTDIGDFVELEFKSQKTYQLPVRMTVYKVHSLENI